jgi:leader peptidase (prepilin peptidase)/N-methyltransferase
VFGWLLLRGKARCCGAAIAFRYPFVELLTAALFYVLAAWPPFGPVFTTSEIADGARLVLDPDGAGAFVLHAAFLSLLVALTFIDFDTQLLPDVLTKPGIALGLFGGLWPGLAGALSSDEALSPALRTLLASTVGMLVGGGTTWGVRWLGSHVFKKEAMGFGDVKLMAMIGAFVGWQGALLSLFLGCVFGAVVGSVLALRSGFGLRIPFGPYLAMGAVVTLFLQSEILFALFERWPEWQRDNPSSQWLLMAFALGSLIALFVLIRRGRRRS